MTTIPLVLLLAAQPAPVPHVRATFFPRADVRLLDGPFRDAQLRDLSYLLQLDPDRLLHTFRLNAGLPLYDQPATTKHKYLRVAGGTIRSRKRTHAARSRRPVS